MKNGNAFSAFTERVIEFLSEKKVIDYYQEPLPSPTDETLSEFCQRFMAASDQERDQFQSALAAEHRSLFGIYGHRAATLSVRQEAPPQLLRGLVGAAIANYIIPDKRNVEVGLAIYHHCARKLGLNPVELFTDAAQYAGEEVARELLAFGRRTDVTLKKYGWRELKTPKGVRYKFEWG
jgi:hypothetical protein